MVRRYTHHPIDGEFITLDDLAMFVEDMGAKGMPGTAVIRSRGRIELDFAGNGPRAISVTAEAEPSADDLHVQQSEKVHEAAQ